MYVEISEKLFKSIVTEDVAISEVITTEQYIDYFYVVHGTTLLLRLNHISGINYHIRDINA